MKALAFLMFSIGALASTAVAQNKAKPDVRAPIKDQEGLPRVLLIGDSISMGYTQPVRDILKDKANVHRIHGHVNILTTSRIHSVYPTKNGTSHAIETSLVLSHRAIRRADRDGLQQKAT